MKAAASREGRSFEEGPRRLAGQDLGEVPDRGLCEFTSGWIAVASPAPLFLLLFLAPSCGRNTGDLGSVSREVVVYTALDRSFAEPILDEFSMRTGIAVKAQYDTESTKSVGLANRIRAERDRPRCDVFWNNEILNTLRLEKEGLLAPCEPREARSFPETFRDPTKRWYGFAARARVLIVNTARVPRDSFPRGVQDLADPRWKGRTGIAKPLFGTTASHVACLFAVEGREKAERLLDDLKRNDIQILGGNKGCATAVSEGRLAFALTDTDDAIIEKEAGRPVEIVYPDDGPDGPGTLFLPNALSLIRGAPHEKEARELIDYLLSAEVEEKLAAGPSAQIPLNREARPSARVRRPGEVKAMQVDFARAAGEFDRAMGVVEERFLR